MSAISDFARTNESPVFRGETSRLNNFSAMERGMGDETGHFPTESFPVIRLRKAEKSREKESSTLKSGKDQTRRMFVQEDDQLGELRDDLIAALIHDIKGPLCSADRILNCFLNGGVGEIDPLQRQVIEQLRTSNGQIIDLLLNLLEIIRLERDPETLMLRKTDLKEVVLRTIDLYRVIAEEKGLMIQTELTDDEVVVFADESSIRRVIKNLLTNAIKYSMPGGFIMITLKKEQEIRVSVRDSGVGISEDNQKHLFQRFFRAEAGRKSLTSTGLGLYLCKQVIEAHNGSISCQSEPGKGATFEFVLPLESN